jgi:hypothetical protein
MPHSGRERPGKCRRELPTMTDSSIPLALQPDAFSPLVVTRLAKLPNKVVSRWPVTVHSLPRQALVLQEDAIAIVCDNLTYRATEHDAFSRVTFTDDTHASVNLPLRKTVEVEFDNATEAQQFRTAVTARAATVPPAGQSADAPARPSEPGTGTRAPQKVTGAHKFSRSSIQITTSLSADRVAEISRQVGESTRGGLAGLHHVRFEGASEGRTNFSIRALGDVVEFMTFHVVITDADGGAKASSHIDSFKTKQDKLLMMIPLGPKNMMAYKTYRLFMENIRGAITAADTSSRTVITEEAAV